VSGNGVTLAFAIRHVRKMRQYSSKHADQKIAKYAAKIGGDCIFA